MATVFMPDNEGRVLRKPNAFIKIDRDTAKGIRSSLVSDAQVIRITKVQNEGYSTCSILFPNARFGEHINFGTRIEVFIDSMANKVFDGRIVHEESSLENDTVRVTLYDAKWLLNNNTIVGTYDAKWNSIEYPKANKIEAIKTVTNPSAAGSSNWNNLNQRTIFNEGGEGDRCFQVFQDGAKPVPLFDKKSPHKGLKQIEKEDSEILIDNQYYPKYWRYGDIIAYLLYFHTDDFDVRLSNNNYNTLNNIESPNRTNTTNSQNEKNKPRNLDLNGLPFIQAIGKIFRQIGPRYGFNITTHEKNNKIFYQINVIDFSNAVKRSVKIAKDSSIIGSTGDNRVNVFGSSIKRDASNVITSLRGIGRKVEIEMTIALEPAWDIKEIQTQYDITLGEVQEIFHLRHIVGNNFDQVSTTKDSGGSGAGTGRTIASGETFFEIYHQYRDWFDNKYLKTWRLPSKISAFKNALTNDFAYRGLKLDQMFTSEEDNIYRKFKSPITPLRTTNFLTGNLDSKIVNYKTPVIFTYDSNIGIAQCVPFSLAFKYAADPVAEDPILKNFRKGIVKNKANNFNGTFMMSPAASFSVRDNIISFNEHMYKKALGSTGNDALDRFINSNELIMGNPEIALEDFKKENFEEAQMVFMTAVIDTDLRLTPTIESLTFKDFETAGIKVNRYTENDDYKVVIRDHSVLLNLQYYVEGDEVNNLPGTPQFGLKDIKASTKSKERAGNLKLNIASDNSNVLRVKSDKTGRFEEYSDGESEENSGGSGGPIITNVTPFIDDYDDYLDHLQERLDAKAKYKESMSFTLGSFDTSYDIGENITDVLNSDKVGSGFIGQNCIITSIVIDLANEFKVSLTASDILAD